MKFIYELGASGDLKRKTISLVRERVVIHKHTLYFIRLNKISIYSPNFISFFVSFITLNFCIFPPLSFSLWFSTSVFTMNFSFVLFLYHWRTLNIWFTGQNNTRTCLHYDDRMSTAVNSICLWRQKQNWEKKKDNSQHLKQNKNKEKIPTCKITFSIITAKRIL